jgi:hypothetical protein
VNSEEASAELARYTARATRTSGEREWTQLHVEILRDGVVIGSYERNYGLMDTFHPFVGSDGGLYALYSRNYTATRVMSLPDCRDLGGEEPSSHGFCPVEFFVPYDPARGIDGSIGFVAGCVWGDDSSWKVQFLDLSRVADGVVAREERFGYLELEDGVSLADAIDLGEWNMSERAVRIRAVHRFEIERPDGAPDQSLVRDDRGVDPAVSVPEIPSLGRYDAFHAEFYDPATNGSHMHSQEVASFAESWNIAIRWHAERGVHVNVRGRAYGQYGTPPDAASWVSVAYVDRDSKVVVFP